MQVDLKLPSALREVIVTGRRDCCWNYQDLPLLLELSTDGSTWREVARRELPISDRDRWRVELNGAEGRYLRLRVPSKRPSAIVLTEIEVFGTPLNP